MKHRQEQLEDVSTVRILMLGDRGVGKTSVTNLLARTPTTPTRASRTVGEGSWNVQVRLHEYPSSVGMPPSPTWTTPSSSERSEKCSFPRLTPATCEILHFVEFYDLNCDLRKRRGHRGHRQEFLKHIDGIVLVYNLLDPRSQDSLHDWLYEPLRQICKHRHRRPRPILRRQHVPILVVGTQLDKFMRRSMRRHRGIAHQLGADEILLNGRDSDSFAERSRNQGKLSSFLNRVVEFKERFPVRSWCL
ncbi:hypothetical protein KR009_005365 [Drosophila setifemur]|nr:hypothetical protein KR009_005365 [Drosophila setifemur]